MDLTRRQLLAGAVGGGAAVGGGRAIYNVFLGYDRFTGTNLLRQDLDPLVLEYLQPSGEGATVDGYRIEADGDDVTVHDGDTRVATLDPSTDDPASAAAVDDELGLADGPLEEVIADLGALEAGDVRFVYDNYPGFFELVESGDDRPYTVAGLRGRRSAEPDLIGELTGADPRDPKAVAEGLAETFREHTNYDVPRYVAGSIEDNVLLGRYDLRRYFESPTDFESMVEGRDSGLFCYDLTRRSVEALQATPAPEQTTPVFAGFVRNARHKHVYTVVASAIRDNGELVIPVTFLDYTHSTLYDDFRLRRILGEGLDAYDDGHRATEIAWYRY
ncbi:hypothetical protein [Natrialbaceae archaeon AArc-T1-2]|uniref:hypothetical protein n=1 Tax=Natrialbaceae archaeon AArc-T1-2 TaxID=3053904 RepID=UPI00255B0F52|nr:hypothetical protein [Natrialbaceae archaeon AArc-T1-2]WIV66751.1 hypothetical protein QQ977_13805 [Natrialbaceae archaeon AArc-T1-2]